MIFDLQNWLERRKILADFYATPIIALFLTMALEEGRKEETTQVKL